MPNIITNVPVLPKWWKAVNGLCVNNPPPPQELLLGLTDRSHLYAGDTQVPNYCSATVWSCLI